VSAATQWACKKCGTTNVALKYTGKEPLCKDCKRFENLKINSTRKRKHAKNSALCFTRDEFLEWSKKRLRKCAYCGIRDTDLAAVGLKTQIGRDLNAVGVDRLDSSKDYTIDNICLCCFACNKAKGNVFSDGEMRVIGKAVADVWQKRLKATP